MGQVEAFCRTLPGKHAEIARLLSRGWKKAQISRELKIHRNTVADAIGAMKAKAAAFFGVREHPLSGWEYAEPAKKRPGRYFKPTLHFRRKQSEVKKFEKAWKKLKSRCAFH